MARARASAPRFCAVSVPPWKIGAVSWPNMSKALNLLAAILSGWDVDWVIVAQETSAEALVPVEEFTRNLILSTAGMIIFVCLLSLLLAQIFVRPLRRLKTAAQRIAAGEEGVQVDAGSSAARARTFDYPPAD